MTVLDSYIFMKTLLPTKASTYVQTMVVSVMLTFGLHSTYFWELLLWNPLSGFPGVKDTLWAAFSATLSFSFSSSFLVLVVVLSLQSPSQSSSLSLSFLLSETVIIFCCCFGDWKHGQLYGILNERCTYKKSADLVWDKS